MVEGLTRYQSALPSDATVAHDRQSLNDLAMTNPKTILHPENGGYYLKATTKRPLPSLVTTYARS
ncbi:hypothetical protein N7520_007471 [Penicillium odoratum]|uniref:uncharacterized protein n=1 Tax=Penicillium odoratum TaxID=1167516 RepID=UPI0025475CAF|nr:uncharacterized protein N7520_007471 [Penicillium odoratum]KAJ5760315.1 hypothetical protein N7520_007471 [Penicillium odoratum]